MTNAYITREGKSLSSLYFLPEKFTHMLIACHGFRGTKENAGRIYSFAGRLNDMGVAVLAFDFSGSGASSGDFKDMTLSTQADDLTLVIDEVFERFGCPIILLGRSFGGSTVLAGGSSDPRVAAFVFWSTPFMLEKAFREMFGDEYESMQKGRSLTLQDDGGEFIIGPGFVRDLSRHVFGEYAEKIGYRPALIIHGQQDELVELQNAVTLHENLANSELIVVPGADHKFFEQWPLREQLTLEWIEKQVLKRSEMA